MTPTQTLTLRGVRVHNLKNIDVAIPLHRLTVVTGVCGGGKSSLVFDTLYAEAQRRYLQSFSVYTRQFLERFEAPDADWISDLPPAIAIRRSNLPTSPRVTVGTLTELDAPLRLLFARAGVVVCPGCGQTVKASSAADVMAAVAAMPQGTRATIAFAAAEFHAAALLEEGYVRIQIGGAPYRLDAEKAPTPTSGETVWVLLDRIEAGKTPGERLAEAIDAAFRRGDGRLGVLTDGAELVFDQRLFCLRCHRLFPPIEPRRFDPNDPAGACAECEGTGAIGKSNAICPTCAGRRLNTDALAVHLGNVSFANWQALALVDVCNVLKTLPADAGPEIGGLIEQIRLRAQSLVALDLGYLTLGQPAATLGDGSARRIDLAAALASNLVNVLYLIDEPTVGLPPRGAPRLVAALQRICERGNTVVVVDSERAVIAAADHVIDLGPGGGDEGGNITYQGPPSGLSEAAENPTSDFWTGRDFIEVPEGSRKESGLLKLTGVATNNLQILEVAFPLGMLCAVTGTSGAGKRSLVEQTLYPALRQAKKKEVDGPPPIAKVSGAGKVTDVILLDQTPLGRSVRSNPATYLKIFDEIRTLFSQTVDAKIRNYGPGHFSFNQPGGRCESCEGQGTLTIDMQFLADVRTLCPECQGRRYRKEILAIKVRSLSIADVLDLTVREAFRFFRAQPAIEKKLKVLRDVGLDYLRIGQAVETLSGSECQRLKLAGHLASSRKSGCLFLLIEPSAGLHPADVANLLDCFERLLAAGHSLIVIDNDADVIRCADWVIELERGRIVAEGHG